MLRQTAKTTSRRPGNEDAIIRHFGALYINEIPVEEYPVLNGEWLASGEHLRLGDTNRNGLPWIDVGHAYISVNPLITGISLDCLRRKGLHRSKKVLIDGLAYQMRLMRAGDVSHPDLGEIGIFADVYGNGSAKDYPKVWYDIPSIVSEDEGNYFRFSDRIVREKVVLGGAMSNEFCSMAWQPVLEPIQPDLAEATGENIVIWTKTGEFVTGNLVEVNEYDLLLASGLCLADDGSSHSPWVSSSGFCMAVDREGIWSLQAYNKEAV